MPRFAAAHSNLASILKEQGKVEQAICHYMEAIQIDPRFADAYSNLGNAYKELGRLEDAIKCYDAAIKLKPTFSDAYSNLGSAYKDSGRIDDAIHCYRQALALRPNFPDAFCNLVHSLVLICDWSSRDTDFATLRHIMFEQVTAALTHFRASKPPTPSTSDGSVVAFPAATTGTEFPASFCCSRELLSLFAELFCCVFSDVVASTIPPLPSVQPFHALVYPFTLDQMAALSKCYADRCVALYFPSVLAAANPLLAFGCLLQRFAERSGA